MTSHPYFKNLALGKIRCFSHNDLAFRYEIKGEPGANSNIEYVLLSWPQTDNLCVKPSINLINLLRQYICMK